MPRDYRPFAKRKTPSQGEQGDSRRRLARGVVVFLLLFFLALGVFFREILFPFMIGGIIAYLLGPVVGWLVERRIPRALAVFGSLILAYSSAAAFLYSFFPQFSEEGQAGLVRIQEFLEDAPELYAGFEGELEGWVNQGATELEGMDGKGLELPPPEAVMDSMWKGRIDPSSAQILIQPLTSGGYGIALQDSAFDVETAGKGVRVKPVPRIREQASFETLKKDLVANLRSAVEGFGTRFMAEFVRFIRSLVTGLLGALVGLTLTFMVAGFLLLEMPEIRNWARRTIPSRFHEDTRELLTRLNDGLSGVVRGQILICVVNGILSFIGFLIFIPKYAFVMAMLAGVMSLIPIFGTIISSIPVVLVGLTVSFGTAVALLAWILGIHFVEGNFLNPKIIGTAAKINPVIVIFVLVAAENQFGIPGALLAVPITSVVLTLASFAFERAQPYLFKTS